MNKKLLILFILFLIFSFIQSQNNFEKNDIILSSSEASAGGNSSDHDSGSSKSSSSDNASSASLSSDSSNSTSSNSSSNSLSSSSDSSNPSSSNSSSDSLSPSSDSLNSSSSNSSSTDSSEEDVGCIIYISNDERLELSDGSDSSVDNCGTKTNPCLSLDLGIKSCEAQQLESNMTFYFGNGTFQYSNNNSAISLYDQTINLIGDASGSSILDFGNLELVPAFLVNEPINGNSMQTTSITMSQLTIQNFNKGGKNASSVFYVQSTNSNVKLDFEKCTFTNIYTGPRFQPASILYLQGTKTLIDVRLNACNFTSIHGSDGVVLLGTYVIPDIIDCKFTKIITNGSIISIQFSQINLWNIEVSQNSMLSFLASFNQTENAPTQIISNSTFSNNQLNPPTASGSLIYATASQIELDECNFIENQITLLWFKYNLPSTAVSVISNCQFKSNNEFTIIIADAESNVNIQGCTFTDNLSNYAMIEAHQSNTYLTGVIFNDNTGLIISSIASVLKFDSITLTGHNLLVNCTNSTITFVGDNVIDNSNSLTCDRCTVNSSTLSNSSNCLVPSDTSSSSSSSSASNGSHEDKKKGISKGLLTFLIIISIIAFLCLVVVAYYGFKRFIHKRHGYQRI